MLMIRIMIGSYLATDQVGLFVFEENSPIDYNLPLGPGFRAGGVNQQNRTNIGSIGEAVQVAR